MLVLAVAAVAHAHGGAYQPPPPPMPPAPSVPPGQRLGGPTTGGGDVGGPTTPGGTDIGGPTTGGGGPGKGPTTPSGSSPGPGGGPTTGGGGGAGGPTTGGGPNTGGPNTGGPWRPTPKRFSGAPTGIDHWTRWWYPNRREVIDWTARVSNRRNAAITPSGSAARSADEMWRCEVQAALQAQLDSRDEDLASGAAVALGKLGDPADVPSLVGLLRDISRQQPVREAAALGLGLIPATGPTSDDARRALEAVVAELGEPDRLRAVATYALGLRGADASLPLLLDAAAAGDATWDVPAAAISSLGMCGHELVEPDLLEILAGKARSRERTPVRRVYAAHALSTYRTPESVAALRAAASDDDVDVRRAAVLALGAVATADDDETMDVLTRVLYRDRDAPCRHVAALSIGRIGHDRGEAALRHAYKKGDSLLQPFAALGLGLYARHDGHVDAADIVVRDLEERANAELRSALAIAVGLSGNSAGAPVLREIVADRGDPALRGHAAVALGLLGDRDLGAPLLRSLLLEAKDPDVQREVALGLGMLGDRDATRLLVGLVDDGESVFVQGSAAMALGRIGGRDAGRALLDLLRDDGRPKLARAMAAVGLGLLLDPTEGRRIGAVGANLDWYLFTPTVQELLTIL